MVSKLKSETIIVFTFVLTIIMAIVSIGLGSVRIPLLRNITDNFRYIVY